MEKNLIRVLNKFNLKNSTELNSRLNILPRLYQEVFKAKWGLDVEKKSCSYGRLAQKLGCDYDAAKELARKANNEFAYSKYLFRVFTPQQYDMNTYHIAKGYCQLILSIFGMDLPKDFNVMSFAEAKDIIDNFLASFTEQESYVLKARFGLETGHPKSLVMVGSLMGRSKERVRQIEMTGLNKLRFYGRSRKFIIDPPPVPLSLDPEGKFSD